MTDDRTTNDDETGHDGAIRVFIVDDHHIAREGLRVVLDADPRVYVVGEAATYTEAIGRIAATRPRVAILDVILPDGSGIDLCRTIRHHHPETSCVVFTAAADDETLVDAVEAGATGFLLKSVHLNALVDAIQRVADGGSIIDSQLVPALLEHVRSPPSVSPTPLDRLTGIEREVLRHLADGHSNRQIAPLVHLSEASVKNYVSSILNKLGVQRRTEAVSIALRSGEFD